MESTRDVSAETVYDVGIDAGSKTIKIVAFDTNGKRIYDSYQRHGTNIKQTLEDALGHLALQQGDVTARFAVTGSAGIEVSEMLGIPFVQEVIAATKVVKEKHPEADAVIELGGEDSKIIYLTGELEQRMNSSCAGGTGGFIDTIAYMLGVRTDMMSELARSATNIYPIASRCAVFAQTDVRPLLNSGATKADIAASVHEAVVRQTLGGLACGRPIRGNVVFLGGPLEFNRDLLFRFRQALGLDSTSCIKPSDAHLYTATGAALVAHAEGEPLSLNLLREKLSDGEFAAQSEDIDRLAPLFENEEDRLCFKERHARSSYPRARLVDSTGPLYLGIDSGSTTTKLALVDSEGRLVYQDYEESHGDTVGTIRDMLLKMYRSLAVSRSAMQVNRPYVANAVATGYGEQLLCAGFGVDSGLVETMAHARAAKELEPDVTFMLDIGGQDMKAIWMEDGQVKDVVLNEACSSGCGAFVSGTAFSVQANKDQFAEYALHSNNPVDLGTKCTVFMSSRVKHAQKSGASVEDIAAGVAYSVIQNALFRIIGADKIESMGDKVVVGGGTFKSDAILRAFELIAGVEALRPIEAHLMGAIGAALVARDRALSRSDSDIARSSLVSRDWLFNLQVDRTNIRCDGCQNACSLSVLSLGDDRRYVSGNKCERGRIISDAKLCKTAGTSPSSTLAPAEEHVSNIVKLEQDLLHAFGDAPVSGAVANMGLLLTLDQYENRPFWHTLFKEVGLGVITPDEGCEREADHRAWESVPAEAMCYPAKLAHARAFSLKDKGATHIFATSFERGHHCPISSSYAATLKDSVDFIRDGDVTLVAPLLTSSKPQRIAKSESDSDSLYRALASIFEEGGSTLERAQFGRALDRALQAQEAFEREVQEASDNALAWLAESPERKGIVLVGRPYHNDPALADDIDKMLVGFGFAVLSPLGIAQQVSAASRKSTLTNGWDQAKRLVRIANYIASQAQLNMVCLQSFGCGYDAMALEEVRLVLEDAGKPYAALKLDEMVDRSHIRIRLRTLADVLEAKPLVEAGQSGQSERDELQQECGETGYIQTQGRRADECGQDADSCEDASDCDNSCARENDNTDASGCTCSGAHTARKIVRVFDSPLDASDYDRARTSSVKDACFAAKAMAAKAIRVLEENPDVDVIELPRISTDCLSDAVPALIELSCGRAPEIRWVDKCPDIFSPDSAPALCDDESRPKIGILGNPLFCYDELMNDHLIHKIDELGCEPVLCDPDLLMAEDVSYRDALKWLDGQDVKNVIYVQSFGCLKANSQLRGQLNELKREFPRVSITAIDYDPESSELNRENRIRLVVESAQSRTMGT